MLMRPDKSLTDQPTNSLHPLPSHTSPSIPLLPLLFPLLAMSNATLSGDVPAASASPGISLEQLRRAYPVTYISSRHSPIIGKNIEIPIGFTCAAFLITIFRLYARRKSLGLDDLFATLAFIANLAQTAVLSKMYFEPRMPL
jgi:hypothetical protein